MSILGTKGVSSRMQGGQYPRCIKLTMLFDKNNPKDTLRGHMICQNLIFIIHMNRKVSKLINLTNLDDKSQPS